MLGTGRIAAIVVAAALASAAIGSAPGASAGRHHDRAAMSGRALALHDRMRALWESHGT